MYDIEETEPQMFIILTPVRVWLFMDKQEVEEIKQFLGVFKETLTA